LITGELPLQCSNCIFLLHSFTLQPTSYTECKNLVVGLCCDCSIRLLLTRWCLLSSAMHCLFL